MFDGTNDFIRSDTGDGGIADGTTLTAAVWIKPSVVNAEKYIFSMVTGGTANRLNWTTTSAGKIRLRVYDTSAALVVDLTGSQTLSTGTWYQIHFAVDTTSSSNTKLWVNGVEDTSLTETVLGTANGAATNTMDLAFSGDRFTIGGDGAVPSTTGSRFNGVMAELWINDSYVNDNTKFYSAGHPVDLGTNGATPIGGQPCFYFSRAGSGDAWRENQGSANTATWTLTGTLGTDTSP